MPQQVLDYRSSHFHRRPSLWTATALEIEGGLLFTVGVGWCILMSMMMSVTLPMSAWRLLRYVLDMVAPLCMGGGLLMSAMLLRDGTRWSVRFAAACIILTVLLIAWPVTTLLYDALFRGGLAWPSLRVVTRLVILLALPAAILVFQIILLINLLRHAIAERLRRRRTGSPSA